MAAFSSDIIIAQDGSYMAEFLERLGKGEATIMYGIKEVELAAEMGAVDVLMICDVLLRVGISPSVNGSMEFSILLSRIGVKFI